MGFDTPMMYELLDEDPPSDVNERVKKAAGYFEKKLAELEPTQSYGHRYGEHNWSYQGSQLYLESKFWSFVFRHTSPHPWQLTTGIDKYSIICLSCKFDTMERGMLDRVALNVLNFKHCMTKFKTPHPEYVNLTTDGVTFNLYFRAYRPLTDWFNAGTASCTMAGLMLLREAAILMVRYMINRKLVTEYPLISLIFKLDNNF